jgi:hypothetical protein
MGGAPRAGLPSRNQQRSMGSNLHLARPSRRRCNVPSWESFPVADRQQLVNVILQTARRQAVACQVNCRPKA